MMKENKYKEVYPGSLYYNPRQSRSAKIYKLWRRAVSTGCKVFLGIVIGYAWCWLALGGA